MQMQMQMQIHEHAVHRLDCVYIIWCIKINANCVHCVAFCERERKLSEMGAPESLARKEKKLKKRRSAHIDCSNAHFM